VLSFDARWGVGGQDHAAVSLLPGKISSIGVTIYITEILKGKAVPLQAWSGLEGSRTLKFPDFMITAQDGGKVLSLTHRPPLTPGNTPGTHFC